MEANTATETDQQSALHAGTLPEAFARTVARRGNEPAMRSSDGQTTLTWSEVDSLVRAVAGGLSALGVGRDGTVAMLLTNRYEAAVVDLATLHIGAVPLSLYNSSSMQQLAYLFDDSRTDVVVTESALAPKVMESAALSTGKPKVVVIDGDSGADVNSLDELTGLGDPLPAGELPELSPDDLITVVYTSGTTGDPKGAELTHYNILEQIRGLHSLGRMPMDGSALSYLPFAHMGDRLCAYYMPVVAGACITYHGDPRTASDLLPAVQPTLYMAVPRIWEKLQGTALRWMADHEKTLELEEAVTLGGKLHDDRVAGNPVDSHATTAWESHGQVLGELRDFLGLGAGELLFTGGAPLAPETLRFFAAIGVDLCECYGQSETAGIILCNPAERPRPLTNGIPMPGVEAKIADDGELLLKGPMVMRGYRGKPDLTAASYEDGWLLTGDIFDTDEVGYYRIIDRKKEIIVSSSGKNISPVYVENTISGSSPLIMVVACIGDARSYNTALIALEPEGTAALTGESDPAANARNPKVVEAITEAIRNANQVMNTSEQVKRFMIVGEIWMPGTDELTPTMKLKRKPIAEKHADRIEALYGPKSDDVVEV